MASNNFDRRVFLKRALFGSGALLSTGALGKNYLDDTNPVIMPGIEGYVRADLHVHMGANDSKHNILNALSLGIVGLSKKYGYPRPELSYEDALLFPEVKEVENGFAKVQYSGKTGFIIRNQEFLGDNHVLGIGVSGYSSDPCDSFRSVRLIKHKGGIVNLVHPAIIPDYSVPLANVRLAKNADMTKIYDLAMASDSIEVFNSAAKNLIPGVLWFSKANELAEIIAQETCLPRLKASDSHYNNGLVFITGIYVRKPNSLDELKSDIVKGNYILGPDSYQSRSDVLVGKLSDKFFL